MSSVPRPLPYGRQLIEDDDLESVAKALRGDFLTTGPMVESFEDALASVVGARHAVACANGTAALHLSALALGFGPGDIAIVPAVTFLATANAIRFVGAEVVFADVEPDTGLMNGATLEAAISELPAARGNLRAAYPVALAGQCADMAELADVARRHSIPLVHDACHALGTTYQVDGHSFKVGDGSHETLSTFSFHPVKTIAMGEGGAVTTDNSALHQRLLKLRNHGMTRANEDFQNLELAVDANGDANPWYYEMQELGFNYRVPDILCALGVSQLSKLHRFSQRRLELAARYERLLEAFGSKVRMLRRTANCQPVWHLFVVLIDFPRVGKTRAQVMRELHEHGIGTQVHYIPVPRQPYYAKLAPRASFPGADAYYERTLSLPLFASMTVDDVDRVVDALHVVLDVP